MSVRSEPYRLDGRMKDSLDQDSGCNARARGGGIKAADQPPDPSASLSLRNATVLSQASSAASAL